MTLWEMWWKKISVDSDGSLIFRWTYLFDERGRKTPGEPAQ